MSLDIFELLRLETKLDWVRVELKALVGFDESFVREKITAFFFVGVVSFFVEGVGAARGFRGE